LRRIIIIGAAAAVLIGAGAAYGAGDFNSYTVSNTVSPSGAGSSARPSPFARHEVYTAQGNGQEAGPITHIVEKFYGVVTDGKDFPVCTAKMINDAGNTKGWNRVCPKGSIVAQGPVQSLFVPSNSPTGAAVPCNPYLYVYNGGQGVQVDFFTEPPFAPGPQYTCAGGAVKTGAAAAYNVYYQRQGGYEVVTVPVPPNASTSAGGLPGIYASLIKLDLTYKKLTKKVHGKTVSYEASIACKKGQRPYSYTFTARNYQGQSPSSETTTVSHSSKC
jgi:hypothetical protein